jgi:4-amino-4-deoxy-L-arabinose transferase-like glycosyltransferase
VEVALGALLGAALLLRLPLIAGGQIDFDEGTYLESLRALAAGHPLFSSVYSSQPPGFLLLLLPGYLALGSSVVAARLTVVALAIAGAGATFWIGSRLASRRAGLVAAAVLLADPLFFRQSVALQADGPSVALALAALALAVEARLGGRRATLLAGGAGVVLALAVLTKLLALAAAPAVLLALITPSAPPGRRRRSLLLAATATGGALACAAVLLPFAAAWPQLWHQVVGYHLGARSLALGGLDGPTLERELPLAGLAVAGLVLGIGRAPELVAVAVTWAVAGVIILALQHPLWPHHTVLLLPPLALLTGALGLVTPTRPRLVVAGAVLAGATLASAFWVGTQARPASDAQAEVSALRAVAGPGDLVVTDDQFAAVLADRSTPPELVDTSLVRVRSGDLSTAQAEAIAARPSVRAVLLATGRLDTLPGFEAWVSTAFPHHEALGDRRTVFWR